MCTGLVPAAGPSPRVRGIQVGLDDDAHRCGSIPAGAGNPGLAEQRAPHEAVHPRGCGESKVPCATSDPFTGPSPRVRGIRAAPSTGAASRGSIPAGAGNPSARSRPSPSGRVHPRGCGESVSGLAVGDVLYGPSPRVRGILPLLGGGLLAARSIPAGAGNPRSFRPRRRARRVHPRGCGESWGRGSRPSGTGGPSPRVRGILVLIHGCATMARSIPAGAGNPGRTFSIIFPLPVHPRGCGESLFAYSRAYSRPGPSPRVRGIRSTRSCTQAFGRSIPAGAGNPNISGCGSRRGEVHPRGCGESGLSDGYVRPAWGPSPRVRGIHRAPPVQRVPPGSIPAGAGNPRNRKCLPPLSEVHPRGCGESVRIAYCMTAGSGPSPRVRGIPASSRRSPPAPRSIPAGAGNPWLWRAGLRQPRVHPRGCGESAFGSATMARHAGPSPRVRGIRRPSTARRRRRRSIPAGAGNPSGGGSETCRQRVHPRGCGESVDERLRVDRAVGPSPRVRGIPPAGIGGVERPGSIPAGAGNPPPRPAWSTSIRVHPRGCGESGVELIPKCQPSGPSPRVRGILGLDLGLLVGLRSIPAGAGNPTRTC